VAAFWARGFAATSVDDLVGRTGVNRASLYAAYPDKRRLFLASLRHYLETVTGAGLRRLAEGERASAAVRRFLRGIAAQRAASSTRPGCLLTNTAVELGDRDGEVVALVRGALRRVEGALRARLEEARAQGDLHPGADPRRLARQLLVLVQGIRVMSRLGGEEKVVRDAVESALAPLGRGPATGENSWSSSCRASRSPRSPSRRSRARSSRSRSGARSGSR
jgi:TetR/AcrR family transcriptional repressor of nem operon